MNVSILSSNRIISCRPDTTIGYEDRDFYVPTGAESLSFAPALFIRMGKAGKCISRKFAGRYFESVCPGVLIYVNAETCPAGADGAGSIAAAGSFGAGAAVTSALFDYSTMVPKTFYNKATLTSAGNNFEIMLDGKRIYTFSPECGETSATGSTIDLLESAVEKVSSVMSQRIGDLVAVELCRPQKLADSGCGRARLTGSWCENPLFDREIVF